MTRQEEIREGIGNLTFLVEDTEYWEIGNHFVLKGKAITKLLDYLHSQGVVLEVKRELPEFPPEVIGDITRDRMFVMDIRDKQYKEASYVAVESLIKKTDTPTNPLMETKGIR